MQAPIKSESKPANLSEPAELPLSEQWSRLTGVLRGAINAATDARQFQSAASQQLDLAQYALAATLDELSAVMSVPGRRERASVHRLNTAPSSPSSKAMAA